MKHSILRKQIELRVSDSTGLIPDLNTGYEIDQFEAQNIALARSWGLKSRYLRRNLLFPCGVERLHKEMFCGVWEWAGKIRAVKLAGLQSFLVNFRSQVQNELSGEKRELEALAVALFFWIATERPFSGGNTRLGQLAADLLLTYHHQPCLYWMGSKLFTDPEVQHRYLLAMDSAGEGDLFPLLSLARQRG